MTSLAAALQPSRMVGSANVLPLALVGGMGICDFAWNAFLHLQWTPPVTILAAPAYIFLALFVICKIAWPKEAALELLLYLGLWLLFPIFGSHLSYLAATANLPLQDVIFARADASLGFNWLYWFKLVWAHPQISSVLVVVYESYLFQPLMLVLYFAVTRVPDRNRELLVATILAVLFVVAVSAILPAYGPPREYGIPNGWDDPLSALRHGSHVPFGYVGIVTFPSLHACLAVLFALSMRGHLLGSVAAAALNAAMIVSTAPLGGHYLVDLIAGCAVAAISFGLAKVLLRFSSLASQPAPLT